jgi:hypothetical protein
LASITHYENAFIDPIKIRDYILSPSHPVGRFKAGLLMKIGYSQDNWQELLDDIKRYHLLLDAEDAGRTEHGEKYTITGEIKGPNGKTLIFTSVWIVLSKEDFPRFVTIYPKGGQK